MAVVTFPFGAALPPRDTFLARLGEMVAEAEEWAAADPLMRVLGRPSAATIPHLKELRKDWAAFRSLHLAYGDDIPEVQALRVRFAAITSTLDRP